MKYLTILGLFSLSNAYAYDTMITVISCYAKYTRVRIPEPENGVPPENVDQQTSEFKCGMVQGQRSAALQLNDHMRLNLNFKVNSYKSLMPTATLQDASETLDADRTTRIPAKETEPLRQLRAVFDASDTEHKEGCLIKIGTCRYTDGKVDLHCQFEYTKSVYISPCENTSTGPRPSTNGVAQERPQFDIDPDAIVIDGRPRIEGDDRRPGQAPFVNTPRIQQRSTPMDSVPEESPPVRQPLVPRRYTPSTP